MLCLIYNTFQEITLILTTVYHAITEMTYLHNSGVHITKNLNFDHILTVSHFHLKSWEQAILTFFMEMRES